MKTKETPKSKQVFEICTRKEITEYMMDCYITNKEFLDDDSSLYVEYKDGSHYYISGAVEEGRFKKSGIKVVIESNPSSFVLYGAYRIYNIDDTDEEYSDEADNEEKTWNVDVA
ncbi:hypothetical protein [Intestinimonas butyriciproducens]|uniref:hypothetical protein n=1 Tax=Intestinimonas butyriciproducens TaxID=1297617 RepID=UPI00189E828D|nr:hypothetical protein [Intestinimonas butyriciproducens]